MPQLLITLEEKELKTYSYLHSICHYVEQLQWCSLFLGIEEKHSE